MMKTCSKCRKSKGSEAFSRCFTSPDGLQYWCKDCQRERNALPEVKRRRAIKAKVWQQANRKSMHASKNRYRATILGRSLQLLDNARQRAERLHVPFDLTRDWIIENLGKPCALTGRRFDLSKPSDGVRANPDAPSVDRIDNSLGYTIGNVRLITVHANVARNEFSDDALVALARDIIRTISSQASVSAEEGSTAISKESRGQAAPKRAASLVDGDMVSSAQ